MISYQVFKSIGRLYERKYQKDVKDSLIILDPIMKVIDSVFIDLYEKQDIMNKSVQNSFMMAYGESTYFESINLEGPELEKSINTLSKFTSHDKTSLLELLLNSTYDIKKQGIFHSESQPFSDIFYSLTAAKRRIERELDYALCAVDKQSFPLLQRHTFQEIGKISSISDPSHNIAIYDQASSEIVNILAKRLKEYSDNDQWKNSQHLSLLIKNNSKGNDVLYLDSKSIPDANDLEKVMFVPKYLEDSKITAKKLAKVMNVNPRMASYYLDAAEMLGLVERDDKFYKSTDLTYKLDKYPESDRNEIIDHLIRELPVVKALFLYLESNSKTKFTIKDVAKFLRYSTDLSPSTALRRASTITAWLNRKKIIKHHSGTMLIKQDTSQTTLSQFIG